MRSCREWGMVSANRAAFDHPMRVATSNQGMGVLAERPGDRPTNITERNVV